MLLQCKISPLCEFYLPKDRITYINLMSQKGNIADWKIIVKEVLLEVYGKTLANYSASGVRSCRPAINPLLFKGLFGKFLVYLVGLYLFYFNFSYADWANQASNGALSRHEFIKYINKSAYNKRKHKKQKLPESSISSKQRRWNSSKLFESFIVNHFSMFSYKLLVLGKIRSVGHRNKTFYNQYCVFQKLKRSWRHTILKHTLKTIKNQKIIPSQTLILI